MKFIKDIEINDTDNFLILELVKFPEQYKLDEKENIKRIKFSYRENVCGQQLKALRAMLSCYESKYDTCVILGEDNTSVNALFYALNNVEPVEPYNILVYNQTCKIFGQKI